MLKNLAQSGVYNNLIIDILPDTLRNRAHHVFNCNTPAAILSFCQENS